MAEVSNISWTDATWNPWMGCHKVSQGCKNCYMFRDMARYGRDPSVVSRAVDKSFFNPINWKRHGKLKPGSKIFTCSWSDWFIEEADYWRSLAWQMIRDTPEYTYLILTKRVDNIRSRLPLDWNRGYENVWLGITVENDVTYHERMEKFVNIPAKKRFLSVEPMLSSVVLGTEILFDFYTHQKLIDWVIIGGESDRRMARPMRLEYATSLIQECKYFEIPVFFKQTGTWLAHELGLQSWKGDNPSEWPKELQVQEFPK